MTHERDVYALLVGPPSVDDYRRLRRVAGLSTVSEEQARAGLDGAWAQVRVVETATGRTIGMGRIVYDGGWYFHVADMAVDPAHQRRGIGARVLTALLERINADAPPGATVGLLADPPGRALYARHGFLESAPQEVGMKRRPRAS